MTTTPKKLIEVALPLPEINDASAFDKRPGIGAHPKGIHHWWARLPLPTARAILFASVVDVPAGHPETWKTAIALEGLNHGAARMGLLPSTSRLRVKRAAWGPASWPFGANEMR